jgi:F420-dependent oxidoreductase-like protein
MRVCLMIEGQEGVTWDQWVGLAEACERAGFDALFRSDHYVSFGHPTEWGSLDAWASLCALASRTERIRLGTLVSPATFRHPSELAKSVVTADHASSGRIELGMGAGWFEGEHRAYGFPFPTTQDRFSMLEEQVEIVHRLWDRDEDEVTFDGHHYRLEACHALPKPLQDPHPPLILGGGAGVRGARLAARWADEYNMNFVAPDACREGRRRLSTACEAIGRDPATLALSLMTNTLVGSDAKNLHGRAARLLQRRGDSGDPASYLASLGPERIVGTPEQALERLAAYAEAGVKRVMLQHLLHEDLEAVALIGERIIPEASSL